MSVREVFRQLRAAQWETDAKVIIGIGKIIDERPLLLFYGTGEVREHRCWIVDEEAYRQIIQMLIPRRRRYLGAIYDELTGHPAPPDYYTTPVPLLQFAPLPPFYVVGVDWGIGESRSVTGDD